jgi:catechol 2,3-dioxygenase-like lactoylglutathione lyase family enzyme
MHFHSTVLFVKNIERSKDFYTRFLGFSIEHDFGKNVILDSMVTLWEVLPEHIIAKELKTSDESNRFELCFEHRDIEKIFTDLENEGVEFLHKMKEEPWGQRTIRFFDPDRHLIEIGEPLDVFVRNMKKKGMNESEISNKTGINIETVYNLLQS